MANYITEAAYRRQKGALTRAINSGDPLKVLATVQATTAEWEADDQAWPDDWARWQRAWGDALVELSRNDPFGWR
jgi:hypothetical protein